MRLIANITGGARLERYEIHGAGISVYLDGVSRAPRVRPGRGGRHHGTRRAHLRRLIRARTVSPGGPWWRVRRVLSRTLRCRGTLR